MVPFNFLQSAVGIWRTFHTRREVEARVVVGGTTDRRTKCSSVYVHMLTLHSKVTVS